MLFAALEKPRVKDPLAFQMRELGNGYNSLYTGKNVEGSSVTTRLMRKYKCGLQRFRSGWSFVETAGDIGCLHLNLQFATKFPIPILLSHRIVTTTVVLNLTLRKRKKGNSIIFRMTQCRGCWKAKLRRPPKIVCRLCSDVQREVFRLECSLLKYTDHTTFRFPFSRITFTSRRWAKKLLRQWSSSTFFPPLLLSTLDTWNHVIKRRKVTR